MIWSRNARDTISLIYGDLFKKIDRIIDERVKNPSYDFLWIYKKKRKSACRTKNGEVNETREG